MLPAVLPAVGVAAILVAATFSANVDDVILPYKSSARKGLSSATMRRLSPDYIPHGQCSGLITNLSCPPPAMKALEVVVLDREQYAEVRIDDSLATPQVFRRPDAVSERCEGEAHVRVSLSCGGYRRGAGACCAAVAAPAPVPAPPPPARTGTCLYHQCFDRPILPVPLNISLILVSITAYFTVFAVALFTDDPHLGCVFFEN